MALFTSPFPHDDCRMEFAVFFVDHNRSREFGVMILEGAGARRVVDEGVLYVGEGNCVFEKLGKKVVLV